MKSALVEVRCVDSGRMFIRKTNYLAKMNNKLLEYPLFATLCYIYDMKQSLLSIIDPINAIKIVSLDFLHKIKRVLR